MLVLKKDCVVAKRIREAEEYLREKGIEITHRVDGLLISVDEKTFVILDGESRNIERSFPTFAEPTQIQSIEHYITGE